MYERTSKDRKKERKTPPQQIWLNLEGFLKKMPRICAVDFKIKPSKNLLC